MSSLIPFRKVVVPESLSAAIANAAASGTFAGAVETLEADVAAYTGQRYAVATSSSTAALHLAMCALDLKRGDKVLCPINAFVDLPEVVRHFDAEPVFVDTLADGYALDPEKVRETAQRYPGKKLRAILVAHPAGEPAPMSALREIADELNLKIIEDATEMMGSPIVGRYSDMAVLGFGSKIDNTFDGGMLLTDHAPYDERARLLRNHGMVFPSGEATYLYDVLDIGCQYRMQDFSAVYARELFARHDADLERRRMIAQRYRKALKGLDNFTLPKEHPDHLYTQFVVQVATNRDAFARKLKAEGVEVGVQYVPLNQTRYYKEKYGLKVFDFPRALDAYQKTMSLPIYPSLSDDEVDRVAQAVVRVAKDHR